MLIDLNSDAHINQFCIHRSNLKLIKQEKIDSKHNYEEWKGNALARANADKQEVSEPEKVKINYWHPGQALLRGIFGDGNTKYAQNLERPSLYCVYYQ